MALQHLDKRDLSISEIGRFGGEAANQHPGGFTTLWMLRKNGYKVCLIEPVDLRDRSDPSRGTISREPAIGALNDPGGYRSASERELLSLRALLDDQHAHLESRIPEGSDVVQLLKAGFMVIPNVNGYLLRGEAGLFNRHFVLVYGVDSSEELVYYHDPGLPARPRQCITVACLQEAMFSPHPGLASLTAVGLCG